MAMYRIQKEDYKMELFRSTRFSDHYLEKDLEDWLEQNPAVLTDGEPVLIISRQPMTSHNGVPDLIGLDAEGNTLLIELKRGESPRDVIAQALEYTAWLASLDQNALQVLANNYFASKNSEHNLATAWQETFGNEIGGEDVTTAVTLPANITLNVRQRIFVVIEGVNERILDVARYLRSVDVDITLISFRYYRIEGNDEVLDIERLVGSESFAQTAVTRRPQPTHETVLSQWGEDVQLVYHQFQAIINEGEDIQREPTRRGFSYYKRTRDARVFLCIFGQSSHGVSISFRIDSLESYLDMPTVIATIKTAVPEEVIVNHGTTWCVLHFTANKRLTTLVAKLIATNIVQAVN
ncbi:MAG TPA: hypothetical protein VLL52_00845 [Anaerolineae bacterium]|nr:hypothetical protein [Anaerolineae bacterium]